jgi:hypothetical protein
MMNPSSFGSLLPVDDAFGASVEAVLKGRAERQLMASKGNWGSSDVVAMALAQLAHSLGVMQVGGKRCKWGHFFIHCSSHGWRALQFASKE